MSEQINNGGPAFPVETRGTGSDGMSGEFGHQTGMHTWQFPGMTLRDYFATHAPTPPDWWLDGYGASCNGLSTYGRLIADWNWAYADAMLAARGDA